MTSLFVKRCLGYPSILKSIFAVSPFQTLDWMVHFSRPRIHGTQNHPLCNCRCLHCPCTTKIVKKNYKVLPYNWCQPRRTPKIQYSIVIISNLTRVVQMSDVCRTRTRTRRAFEAPYRCPPDGLSSATPPDCRLRQTAIADVLTSGCVRTMSFGRNFLKRHPK
jgi:hypothetical protein